MLDKLSDGYGSNYFSQAVSDYAKRMKPEIKDGEVRTIGEFSEKQWEKLLEKVDDAIEEYKADLKEREEEALEKQKEQRESYVLGACESEDKFFEKEVMLDNGSFRTMRFMKVESMTMDTDTTKMPEQPDIKDTIDDLVADEAIRKLLGKDRRAPYSAMADDNGFIEYKGVVFQCDFEHNRLCLGNVSDIRDCITVELEHGGCLVFNRANIDDLLGAIDMFSPTDITRIMRAIAQDAKLRQLQMEIEDETSGEKVLDKPKEVRDESERQNEQSDI